MEKLIKMTGGENIFQMNKSPINKTNMVIFLAIGCGLIFYSGNSYAAYFAKKATNAVCFTPGMACQQSVVNEISAAQESIKVQAYVLSNPDILAALVSAKQRNIDVKVILDKSQLVDHKEYKAASTYLIDNKIPVWEDYKPPIAHNKILIIDDRILMTGSYNFSESANKNAENFLKISDGSLSRVYIKNFERRLKESRKL